MCERMHIDLEEHVGESTSDRREVRIRYHRCILGSAAVTAAAAACAPPADAGAAAAAGAVADGCRRQLGGSPADGAAVVAGCSFCDRRMGLELIRRERECTIV